MVGQTYKGFTLIELMIVVAVLGILSAIAYPSYTGYIERGMRADAMSEMQQIASRIESNKTTYKRYDRIPLSTIFSNTVSGAGTTFPNSATPLYNITISPVTANNLGSGDWILTATPIAGTRMATDGTMTLNPWGVKCRKTVCGTEEEWSK